MPRLKVFDDCINELSRLPGVGRKTATRLAMHILRQDNTYATRLSNSIQALKDRTRFCDLCGGLAESSLCGVCSDPYRQKQTICIVADAQDILAIEQTARFRGVYHALGGTLSPMDGIGPEELRMDELLDRIRVSLASSELSASSSGKVEVEIIIATNHDIEGDTTALYLQRILREFAHNEGATIHISRIASGLPAGSHIEYADELTIFKAMEGRRRV